MNKQDKKEIMNLIKYKKMLGGRRMNLDITFCCNLKCKNKQCERNVNNLPPYARSIKPELCFSKFEECEEWEDVNIK